MLLTFLVTSPRVAPGLLSWPAWQAISTATRVLSSDGSRPVARAVAAAGHPVAVLPDATVDDILAAAADGDTVWLAGDEESDRIAGALAERVVNAAETGADLPEVEVLHGSYDVPGARLLDLVSVMDRLRTGCPWDREQTHRSLARYLLEETYETLEAIESGDPDHLREELGDLLLQVYFHSRIAAEHAEDGFTIDDVAADIVDKLVRRHPHVFAAGSGGAGGDPVTRDEVEVSWESLKSAEKNRTSVLEGIPVAMPALSLADKVLGRAARVGVQPAADGRTTEPTGDADREPARDAEASAGDALLALVVEARAAGVDAEQALRDAVRRLAGSVRAAEQRD